VQSSPAPQVASGSTVKQASQVASGSTEQSIQSNIIKTYSNFSNTSTNNNYFTPFDIIILFIIVVFLYLIFKSNRKI
jgi:hypothetical protein